MSMHKEVKKGKDLEEEAGSWIDHSHHIFLPAVLRSSKQKDPALHANFSWCSRIRSHGQGIRVPSPSLTKPIMRANAVRSCHHLPSHGGVHL